MARQADVKCSTCVFGIKSENSKHCKPCMYQSHTKGFYNRWKGLKVKNVELHLS